MEQVLILMATYNGEKYLQEQLNSLYAQEDVEVNILVRDDGSTDKTIDILRNNEKTGKLNWYTGNHLNVAFGFFDLMEKASNLNFKYFAFCDQDDVWDHNKLKIALDNLKNVFSPALYYCGQRLVDENLNFLENHYLNPKRTLQTRFVLSDFAGCTGVFNKELLMNVVKFKPNYMLMHDTWILRVCLAIGGKVIVDPKPHISYRQHHGNTVGLQHGFLSNLKQVNQYLNEYKIEELTRELSRGYNNNMIEKYKTIAYWICNYRNDFSLKKRLLSKKNIDFCNKGLNITYKLKVILNKL